jgi:hypothetical protein
MVVIAGIAGIIAGGIMIFLSHLAPYVHAGSFVKDVDVIRCFGRTCTRRESHIIGIMVHLALYLAAGLAYGALVAQGLASGFGPLPLVAYAVFITVFMGGVVMPLEGHGLFGWREDHWFAADLLIMNAVWVILFGLIMQIIG